MQHIITELMDAQGTLMLGTPSLENMSTPVHASGHEAPRQHTALMNWALSGMRLKARFFDRRVLHPP
ncbi:hypothetical protein [Klebsiella pneumoniae]|uniref:hypothetical protein n=1 Tax=Klebsiella pneumoniae TaxID=573 RepID=UPI003D9B6FEC